jgi:hypothetical protein
LRLRTEGILPLLAIEAHEDRVAWIFEHVKGLGLGHTVGTETGGLLSSRAAAELVARVAEIALAAPVEARRNRGPEPTDVLVTADGAVFVTGFAGPFPPPPAMRPPHGEEGDRAAVYRLGVLLAHLLSGVAPQAATERASHGALVRRALIRAMAKPGPPLTERYSDWLRGMLAWDPTERPPLSAVPEGLRGIAASIAGEPLVAWCAQHVPSLRERALDPERHRFEPGVLGDEDDSTDLVMTEEARQGAESRIALPTPFREPDAPQGAPPPNEVGEPEGELATAATLSRPGPPPLSVQSETSSRKARREDFAEDDPTQEAGAVSGGSDGTVSITTTRPMLVRPTIPVHVGPPPEAIREPPRLPMGFLDELGQKPSLAEESSAPPRSRLAFMVVGLYLSVVVLLGTAAILAVLLWFSNGKPPEPDGAVLGDLPAPPAREEKQGP